MWIGYTNKLAKRASWIINDSVGVFQAKYTLPVGVSSIVYEFSGIDGDSRTQLSRKRIEPIWAE